MTTGTPRVHVDSVDGLPSAVALAPIGNATRKEPGRLIILDVFRLAAAVLVVMWHFAFAANVQNGAVLWVARHGWMGVELFFMISGFVICMSSWGRSLGEFFVSRVVRLYPAYWFAVLATTAVVTLWPIHERPLDPIHVIGNLTMFQQFLGMPNVDLSYWTLAVELLFYLLFAIVVWRGVTYRRVVTFCVLWTIAAIIVPQTGVPWLTTVFATPYAPYFTAGVAFYLMYRFGATLLLWGIVGMSYLLALAGLPALNYFAHVPLSGAGAVITVFFAVMAAAALGWFRWFKWRVGILAGSLTYPLYLVHQVVGLTIIDAVKAHFDLPPAVLFLGSLALMLVAAYLIYRLVERPGQRFLKRALQRSLRAMDQPTADQPTVDKPTAPRSAKHRESGPNGKAPRGTEVAAGEQGAPDHAAQEPSPSSPADHDDRSPALGRDPRTATSPAS